MTARDYLTTRLALAEGATLGPMIVDVGEEFTTVFAIAANGMLNPFCRSMTVGGGEQDAAFIADARTSNPVMAKALIAVLDEHWPDEIGCCMGCGCNERGLPTTPYPCPTVRAITDALGADK